MIKSISDTVKKGRLNENKRKPRRTFKKIGSFVLSQKTNWKTPPKERYVPFREVAAYGVGGIGVKFLIFVC